MANLILAWNNRTDSSTLSGGSWQATLPLANIQNRQIQRVARTTNATTAATQFIVDCGQARTIGVLGLVAHNISVNGRVRLTGAESSAAWTNLLAAGSDFTSASWTKATTTVTGNSTAAPDGTTTADTLAATGANSGVYQTATIGAAQAYSFEVWLRADAPTTISLVTIQTPSSTVAEVSCAVTTDWQKFRIQGTTVAGTTAMDCYVGGNNSFSTGEAVYAWDAELLAGQGIIYDSGWVDVWPVDMVAIYDREWEDDNFWAGTLLQSAVAGYQAPFVHVLPTGQVLRHWRVEIGDTMNPDGYVQIGRMFIGAAWMPSVNYAYGAELGFQDPTEVDTSLSGAEYFDVRSRFRVFDFELQYLSATEAYASALDLQRLAGISGEVLVVPDKDDLATQPARAFLGRLRQLTPVRQDQPSAFTVAFQAKELI